MPKSRKVYFSMRKFGALPQKAIFGTWWFEAGAWSMHAHEPEEC
jgi:hypothetical protein